MANRNGGPHVYTIALGAPFLDTLGRAILSGALVHAGAPPDALSLAGMEILLPSRRSARALAETFPRIVPGGALLLPRIGTLGDADEDSELRYAADNPAAEDIVSDLERQVILADIAREWAAQRARAKSADDLPTIDPVPRSAGEAAAFARELARLFDAMEVEEVDGAQLQHVLPEDRSHLARNWNINLDFLTHALKGWSGHLAARGLASRIAQRSRETDQLSRRLETDGSPHPIVAAGSTGSVPATARLLRAISRLPNGAVVLPGLDFDLDEASWAALGPDHPQFGLKALLETLDVKRQEVRMLGEAGATAATRSRILSEAMRPAGTAENWVPRLAAIGSETARAALGGISRIAAANEFEEGRVIALMMRSHLEHSSESLALVTPDRRLARRVRTELSRWRIEVDDSAGTPLDATAHGVFLRLLAEAIFSGFAPVTTLGLLKHPLTRLGRTAVEARSAARTIELLALRGGRPASGIDGLLGAFKAANDKRAPHPVLRRIDPSDTRAAQALLESLASATHGAAAIAGPAAGSQEAAALVQALIEAAEAVATPPDGEATMLWRGAAGEALAGFLAGLGDAANLARPMDVADFPGWLAQLMATHAVRQPPRGHPQLHIWGLLEARLQQADTVILSGLNEGTWPSEAETDPWLGRHMRQAIGLEPPERRLGLQAHDFAEAFSGPRVVLTRAEKAGGAPTVPSRWWWRLDAVAGGLGADDALDPQEPWAEWAQALDPAPEPQPIDPPRPAPPLATRPRTLPVTRIETWIRDPYAIYARHILALQPLDAIDLDPDGRDYGTMIHDALAQLLTRHPAAALPAGAHGELLEIGEAAFSALDHLPGLRAFWWSRFLRIARWFIDEDARLRAPGTVSACEVKGALDIEVPDRDTAFRLTARADRIDAGAAGMQIFDYKTGRLPSPKQIASILAPQMPLEAAILAAGGFDGIASGDPAGLAYVQLSGRNPPGRAEAVKGAPAELASDAMAKLKGLIAKYGREDTPYVSRIAPGQETDVGDYDHLARVKEWSLRTGKRHGD